MLAGQIRVVKMKECVYLKQDCNADALFSVTAPSTIMEKHRQRGERPLSCGGTNPHTTWEEQGRRGESPSSSEDEEPSTIWKGELMSCAGRTNSCSQNERVCLLKKVLKC